MSFVFKRDGRWYVGYRDETGRQVRRKTSATTKEAAKRLAALEEEHAEKVRLGHATPREPPHTWEELCARYSKDVAPGHKNPKATAYQMKHVAPAFSRKLLARLTPGDVQAWLALLQESGLKASSREVLRMRMQAVFSYGKDALGWCGRNPALEVGKVPVPRRSPRYLTEAEVARVLDVAPEWLRPVFAVALYCGLRKGELIGLQWVDVDLVGLVLHVRRSFAASTKSGRERVVGIPVELLPHLVHAKRLAGKSRWVFPNPKGEMRPSWRLHYLFRAALRAAGIQKDLTFRHTRSTFGTHLYRLSGDIRGVQLTMGHHDVGTTTAHYAAVPEDLIRQLAAKLSYLPTPKQLPAATVVDVTPEEKRVETPTSGRTETHQATGRVRGKYKPPSVVSLTRQGGGWAVSVASCRSGRSGTPTGLPRGGA